jgi:hypothetical protein
MPEWFILGVETNLDVDGTLQEPVKLSSTINTATNRRGCASERAPH